MSRIHDTGFIRAHNDYLDPDKYEGNYYHCPCCGRRLKDDAEEDDLCRQCELRAEEDKDTEN